MRGVYIGARNKSAVGRYQGAEFELSTIPRTPDGGDKKAKESTQCQRVSRAYAGPPNYLALVPEPARTGSSIGLSESAGINVLAFP